jgi:hypothetical protein
MHDYAHLRLHTARTRRAAARAERSWQPAGRDRRAHPVSSAEHDAPPDTPDVPVARSAVPDDSDMPRDPVGAGRTLRS